MKIKMFTFDASYCHAHKPLYDGHSHGVLHVYIGSEYGYEASFPVTDLLSFQ